MKINYEYTEMIKKVVLEYTANLGNAWRRGIDGRRYIRAGLYDQVYVCEDDNAELHYSEADGNLYILMPYYDDYSDGSFRRNGKHWFRRIYLSRVNDNIYWWDTYVDGKRVSIPRELLFAGESEVDEYNRTHTIMRKAFFDGTIIAETEAKFHKDRFGLNIQPVRSSL